MRAPTLVERAILASLGIEAEDLPGLVAFHREQVRAREDKARAHRNEQPNDEDAPADPSA